MARILTITLNPALDLNAELDALEPGQVNRTTATRLEPAGKGINVARVLAGLGHQVTVSGLLGEANAAPFERLFADEGLTDCFVRVPGRNRVNIKLAERDGRITDINSAGFEAASDALSRLVDQLTPLVAEHDAVVIGGSLPASLPAAAVADLVAMVRAVDKPVWLDTSGDALTSGLQATPFGIKPNIEELSAWAGRPLVSRQQVADVATALQAQGLAHVVVSLAPAVCSGLAPMAATSPSHRRCPRAVPSAPAIPCWLACCTACSTQTTMNRRWPSYGLPPPCPPNACAMPGSAIRPRRIFIHLSNKPGLTPGLGITTMGRCRYEPDYCEFLSPGYCHQFPRCPGA